MKASKKNKQLLNLLNIWNGFDGIYNPQLHDMGEIFQEFEPFNYLKEWFGFDFEAQEKDRFLSFAEDGTGGAFALWISEQFTEEFPVVFLGSEGQTNIIASSLQDFVCLLTEGKLIDANNIDEERTIESLWHEPYNFEREDMAEKHNTSVEKIKKKYTRSVAHFKKLVSKNMECKTKEAIFEDASKLPNFSKWIDDLVAKNQNTPKFTETADVEVLSLDLSSENLTEIPLSVLDNPNITSLDLSYNEIKEIPNFISKLIHLENLQLNDNKIKIIPDSVGQLNNLTNLDLSDNEIGKITPKIGNLLKLEVLDLGTNKITEIPNSFENLKNLKNVRLPYNQIKSIDLDFTKLENLEIFSIYENDDLKHIDPSIFKVKTLISIDYEDTLLADTLSQLDFISQSISADILSDIVDIEDDLLEELEDNDDAKAKLITNIEAIHQKRIDLYPSVITYNDFANFYQYTTYQDFEKAVSLYEKCIALKDNSFEAYFYTNFAKLYYYNLKTNFKKAEKLFQKAIAEEPDCEFCLNQYASFLKFHKKDYKNAAKLLKKIIKIEPAEIAHQEELAELYLNYSKQPKKGAKIYKKIVQQKPNKKKYLKKYAEILAFDLNNGEKAFKIFKKLLKKKKSADNYLNYILTLEWTNYEEGHLSEILTKATKKYPKDDFLRSEYNKLLLEKNDFSEIDKAIEKGKVTEVDYIPFLQKLLDDKNFDKITEVIEKGLEQFPNSDMITYYKMHLFIQTKADNTEIITLAEKVIANTKVEEIKKKCTLIINARQNADDLSDYDELIVSKNGDIKALIKEAANGFMAQDFKMVLACLKAVEKIDPYQKDMLSMQSSMLSVSKSKDAALKFIVNKAKENNSANPYIILINQYLEMDKEEEAKKYTNLAQEKFSNNKTIAEFVTHFSKPKIEASSIAEFDKLLIKDPDNFDVYSEYAYFLFDEKMYKKALVQYEKMILKNPKDIYNYIDVSQAYDLLNKPKKAKEYLLKALEISPVGLLTHLIKIDRILFKEYLAIAKKKFPENEQIKQYVEMMNKMM